MRVNEYTLSKLYRFSTNDTGMLQVSLPETHKTLVNCQQFIKNPSHAKWNKWQRKVWSSRAELKPPRLEKTWSRRDEGARKRERERERTPSCVIISERDEHARTHIRCVPFLFVEAVPGSGEGAKADWRILVKRDKMGEFRRLKLGDTSRPKNCFARA